MWPSGKATGFGPVIRGFESLHPNQKFLAPHMWGYLYELYQLAYLFSICPVVMLGWLDSAFAIFAN